MVTALIETVTAPRTTSPVSKSARVNILPLLPLVDKVLGTISRHLPSHVDLDDLHSVGVIGLLHAANRYDPEQAKTFEAYASMRIKGAILDEMRRMDTLPRSSRQKAKLLQDTVQILEQELGRAPSDAEIRQTLGLDQRAFERFMRHTRQIKFISLDHCDGDTNKQDNDLHDTIADERQTPGYAGLLKEELTALISSHLNKLTERQRRLLVMLYFENRRVGDIADALGVTQARICQLRTQALQKLRNAIHADMHR